MSRSRRRRSPSPAKSHHAGVAYRMDATVVALATRWSSCGWRPWVRRSLNANIEEAQVYCIVYHWAHITLVSNSFIQSISIAPLQVRYSSETLPTQHGYCAEISRRSTTDNCELRTCTKSQSGG